MIVSRFDSHPDKPKDYKKSLKIPRGNQNPYIEKEQITMAKRKKK
jgi:hypothetical protein